MRTSRFAVLAAGLAVLAAAPAPAAAANAAYRPGPAVFIPNSDLGGVAVVSRDLAWAVGSRTIGTAPHSSSQPLIMRWNGATWQKVASPAFTAGGQLDGVAAISATDAWAVGSSSTGFSDDPPSLTVIEHLDGTAWSRVPSPDPALSVINALAAVSSRSAWAVGITTARARGKCPCRALIEHWDGTAWKRVSSPSGPGSGLSGVAAVPGHGAWAVGSRTVGSGSHAAARPLIMAWNGVAWKRVPNVVGRHARLIGVAAVSARNAWVVGRTGTNGTLTVHWNGTAWKRVPSPSGPHSGLDAVAAVSARDAWAIGNASAGGALIEHWNGSRWNLFQPDNRTTALGLSDVAASSASNAWVVGINGSNGLSGLILHWNGTAWSKPRGGF